MGVLKVKPGSLWVDKDYMAGGCPSFIMIIDDGYISEAGYNLVKVLTPQGIQTFFRSWFSTQLVYRRVLK